VETLLQLFITGILVGSIYALVAWVDAHLQMFGRSEPGDGRIAVIGAYVCLTFYQWQHTLCTRPLPHVGRGFALAY